MNGADPAGDVPLIMAAYLGHTEITRLLLEADADVTAIDPGMKATALHAAAYAGRAEPAKLLIEYGIDIDAQGPYNGYAALHDAIWQNNVETARVIVEAGANLTLRNHEGQTPLEMAKSRRTQADCRYHRAEATWRLFYVNPNHFTTAHSPIHPRRSAGSSPDARPGPGARRSGILWRVRAWNSAPTGYVGRSRATRNWPGCTSRPISTWQLPTAPRAN